MSTPKWVVGSESKDGRFWSELKLETLRSCGPSPMLARYLGHSMRRLGEKCRQNGIIYAKRGPLSWSLADEQAVRDNYGRVRIEDLEPLLGRTYEAIRRKGRDLGLHSNIAPAHTKKTVGPMMAVIGSKCPTCGKRSQDSDAWWKQHYDANPYCLTSIAA